MSRESFPETIIYQAENVAIVICPYCRERIRSPFTGRLYWEKWELLIRLFEQCSSCLRRERVRFVYRYTVRIPEWWEGLPTDEEKVEKWDYRKSGNR